VERFPAAVLQDRRRARGGARGLRARRRRRLLALPPPRVRRRSQGAGAGAARRLGGARGGRARRVSAPAARSAPRRALEENVAEGKAYSVRGTPTFFVNGARFSGSKEVDAFAAEVDKRLAEASQLVATGVPRDRVYIELCAKNYVERP
jgi:hypothetical protein